MQDDFYVNLSATENELRKKHNSSSVNENLIPIPSQYFFDQILKRHLKNNEKFYEEYNVMISKTILSLFIWFTF
jgi:hypothetical protein